MAPWRNPPVSDKTAPEDPAETLLALLDRDLDGDLPASERLDLYARLAERPDAGSLLRRAVALRQAAVTLARASEAAPAPDMAGWILETVARQAAHRDAPARRTAAGGLLGALRDALSGRDDDRRAAGGTARRLSDADLMGVVAGTGASPAEAHPAGDSDDETGEESERPAGQPVERRDGEG